MCLSISQTPYNPYSILIYNMRSIRPACRVCPIYKFFLIILHYLIVKRLKQSCRKYTTI